MGKRVCCVLIFLTTLLHAATLNVGVYNNPPKIFFDTERRPTGFFIDVLNDLAHKNNWTLNYVSCQWDECLQKLENGEIDVMPDVAYSKAREERFDFNNEAVLSSWSVVYARATSHIISIIDLDQKNIAVLKNSIQADSVRKQCELFGIMPIFLEVDTYQRAFELLHLKQVDAAIVNNFYADSAAIQRMEKTSILLDPAVLKFAFTKDHSLAIRQQLDETLKKEKTDRTSAYYQAKKRWLDQNKQESTPEWIGWALSMSLGILVVLIITVIVFKYLLTKKINALKEAEKLLLAQSRHAAMGEMMSMIAHQWKQPLSVLSMIANNIKLDSERGVVKLEKFNGYYEQLSRQIFYLSHTIDDFRDYFKPDKAKEIVKDPHTIIDNALALIGKSLENHGVVVHKEYGHLPPLRLFSNDLVQVLLNLLKNANEAFSTQAIPSKQIIIRTYVSEKNRAVIEVEDNAGGIPDTIKEHIFEPYFTTKSSANGTGLGLYMSKTIIENHFNGTLSMSTQNGSTRFSIMLPL